jgi:hypothetical protein
MPTPAGATWAHGSVVQTGTPVHRRAGSQARKPCQLKEDSMRSHQIIATAIVLLVGFGATKLLLSSPTAADVETVNSAGLDVSKMHVNRNLPVAAESDMTFVSFQGD